ncbi:MAG: TRAP transporter small permease subunit [Rubricoccaceae bacterium]
MTPLRRSVDRLSGWVGVVTSWLLLGSIVAGALAAILRYLAPLLGIAPALNALGDLQWMLFAAVFLLGAAWVLREDEHVRVDVMYGRLSPKRKAAIDLTGTLLLLLPFCALLMWSTWPAVMASVAIREGALDPGGLVRWPVKLLVPVSIVLLALQGFVQGLRSLETLRGASSDASSSPTEAA